jgi:aspartyl-tRNA(Asn)/glutamyl-tRNA(Gln) amidotransferase subunit C
MKINREQVLHIAQLARLGVTEEDLGRLSEQLSNIIENFEILKQVDTTNIPPTSQSIDLKNVISEDVIAPSLSTEEALANAPQQEAGFFKVKAVLEE